MGETIRFGISIDEKLLENFDTLIEEKGYVNRSEAIRDLIRAALVELKWEVGKNIGPSIGPWDGRLSAADKAKRFV